MLFLFFLSAQTLKSQFLSDEDVSIKEKDLREIFQSPILFSDNYLYQNSKTKISSYVSTGDSYLSSSGGKNFQLIEDQDGYGVILESNPSDQLSFVLNPSASIQNVNPLNGTQSTIFTFGSISPLLNNFDAANSASLSWKLDNFTAKGWINQSSIFNNWQTYNVMTEGFGTELSYKSQQQTLFSISLSNNLNRYGMMIPDWSYMYSQSDSLCALRVEQPIHNTPLTLWTEGSFDRATALSGFETTNYSYGWTLPSVKGGLNWVVNSKGYVSIGASSSKLLFNQGWGYENFSDLFGEWKQSVSSKATLNFGTDFQDCNYTAGSQELLYTDQGSRLYISFGPQVKLSKDFSARLDMKYLLGEPDLKYEALQIPNRYFIFSVQGKF
ncbi:hypothetical protein IT6_00135 [Methylacidiphilum caldifontis]|uniref:Uncharacterized protein n=1 Tax=Methylacidiphilum caldifontis TaxID=2795386 RepID=A0A4Y8PGP8_9BACT|nr:hypothetical protein IT6_00135 [Methylacidiphilum caldifontis]TFE71563.1 hypothetical protein A7Q10_04305 [Methylacidiphilum caldifontis]